MPRYVIHAYESIYQGLHGMESYEVFETDSHDELIEVAKENSIEVMISYGNVMDDLTASAVEEVGTFDTDEFYDALEEQIEENIEYDCYRVNEHCTLTNEDIDELLAEDPEEFIDAWCDN